MAPNVAYSVAETELQLGLEAVRGTAAASVSAIPVKAPKYKPDLKLIPDDTLQGSMVSTYDMIRGLRYDSHGWDAYPRLDTFPMLLMAELGSPDTVGTAPASTTLAASATAGAVSISTTASIAAGSWIVIGTGAKIETHLTTTVTGTASPYTIGLAAPLVYAQASGATVTGLTSHKFSLLNNAGQGNQPPSATINDFDGEEWRQLTACQLDQLTLKGNATGLLDYTTTWFGNPAVTPSTPTVSYSTTEAVPGWTCVVSVGGTAVNYVEEWEFDMKRGVKPIPSLTGTQEYFLYYADPLVATGKLTVIEQSGAPELSAYLAGTKESIDFTIYDVSSGYALDLHSSKAIFTTGEIERGANGEVKASLDFTLLPTATDATAGGVSPMTATVANGQTTAYVGS